MNTYREENISSSSLVRCGKKKKKKIKLRVIFTFARAQQLQNYLFSEKSVGRYWFLGWLKIQNTIFPMCSIYDKQQLVQKLTLVWEE